MKSSDDEKERAAKTRLTQMSKAPPPISPLSPKALDLRNHYTFEPVNWDRWRRLDRARLWEAACLVAGFEPPKDDGEEIWAGYQLKDFPKSFFEVWEAVNRDQGFSRNEFQPSSGLMLHSVHVGYFAIWAEMKGFRIAPEMNEIAKRYRKTHPEIVARFHEAYGVSGDQSLVQGPGPTEDGNAPAEPEAKVPDLPPGLTKGDALLVFGGIDYFSNWSRELADPSDWMKAARLQLGTRSRKHPTLWNPVLIAIGLLDRRVSLKKLDQIFYQHRKLLKDWVSIWEERTEVLR